MVRWDVDYGLRVNVKRIHKMYEVKPAREHWWQFWKTGSVWVEIKG